MGWIRDGNKLIELFLVPKGSVRWCHYAPSVRGCPSTSNFNDWLLQCQSTAADDILSGVELVRKAIQTVTLSLHFAYWTRQEQENTIQGILFPRPRSPNITPSSSCFCLNHEKWSLILYFFSLLIGMGIPWTYPIVVVQPVETELKLLEAPALIAA